MSDGKFFGKYRATVLSNADPEFRGRLMLNILDVSNLIPSTWAEACIPLSGGLGPQMGMYAIPPMGAGVWVEFEAGDPNRPVWVGCRWDSGTDVPMKAHSPFLPSPHNIVIQSLGQNSIVLDDMPTNGISLKTLAGASITMNATGIKIDNGMGASIELMGNTVLINNTSLAVIG